MNRLTRQERAGVVRCLVEGCSIRSTARMTGVSKTTIMKLLADLGDVCSRFADERLRGLSVARLQADEIWSFCYAKAKNVPEEKRGQFGFGDVYTFVAIDADTKLAITWLVGQRDGMCTEAFMKDVAGRIDGRCQVTTDGFGPYRFSVPGAFGARADFAQLQKIYRGTVEPEGRYSPPACIGSKKITVRGNPAEEHISTSFVERSNLSMRMGMRRFTRLTNGYSKKAENLVAAVSLHFVYYNFCRVHMTLKRTPAQAAGLTDHTWSLGELVAILEAHEASEARALAG